MIREYGKKVGHIIPFEKLHGSSRAALFSRIPVYCS